MKKTGIIDAPEADAPQDDAADAPLQDPVLQAAEKEIEAKIIPEARAVYHKIVVAGMAMALHGGTEGLLYSLKNSKDPVKDCAIGASHLVLLLRKQAKGVMPLKSMVPAGATLMIKALDFVDKSGILAIDQKGLVRATRIYTNDIFMSFGISTKMMHTAAGKVHAMTQDPAMMDKLRKASGVVATSSPQPAAGTPSAAPAAPSPAPPSSPINSGAA